MAGNVALLYNAAKALCDHAAERHGAITYTDARYDAELNMILPGYFSPAGMMIDSRFIADLGLVLELFNEMASLGGDDPDEQRPAVEEGDQAGAVPGERGGQPPE